jgi:hypothetical protein
MNNKPKGNGHEKRLTDEEIAQRISILRKAFIALIRVIKEETERLNKERNDDNAKDEKG